MGDQSSDLQQYVVEHLDEAIENGWICAYYQPVMRTVSGKLCGVEALARWNDPVHGLLSPAAFIGSLEHARVIHKLDICIIDRVCRQLRGRIDAGKPTVPVSFNLSRLDFDLCDIHEIIDATVRKYKLPRNFMNIEITESVFGADPAFMATVIGRFHLIGYQVWMDDFGSAYSSLNVLKDFEFDEIKIDMEFLNRFGDRSRTIIASVVDMAKRLGIQTLAEGVETREHAEFLRHIGCEKQQGFFYGKPEPYSVDRFDRMVRELGVEELSERAYYHSIGSVNTLSLSERDFLPENTTKDYVTSMPLALVEYDGESFAVLDFNAPFAEALESIGLADVVAAEQLVNDTNRHFARLSRRLVETIKHDEFARQDYVLNGVSGVLRAKYISSHESRTTVLVTMNSTVSISDHRRRERMDEATGTLFSIYEHVDIIHLDEGYSEPVFSQASFKEVYDVPDLQDAVRQFADQELYPGDRDRYIEFMDVDTMIERIDAGGRSYIVGFFRIRDRGGDFTWKLVALIRFSGSRDRRVMVCIRDTSWENDALFQAAYEPVEERTEPVLDAADFCVSDGSLWRALVQDPDIALFWKDAERRFLGCNDAFLDYYGFDSVEAVLGKTDEEMGWHVDPVPYMTVENRVVHEGTSMSSVIGQCIVHGELRDIVATKHPVYRNGRIVGLVGYFSDIANARDAARQIEEASHVDPVTGMLNYAGLEAAALRYVESYMKTGADFYMIVLDIENFKRYSTEQGYEFGNMVLRHVGERIRRVVGVNCVVGHAYADRFIVLQQGSDRDDVDTLGWEIVDVLGAISEVGGTPCTVYSRFSVVAYSEAESFEELKRLGRARIHESRTW